MCRAHPAFKLKVLADKRAQSLSVSCTDLILDTFFIWLRWSYSGWFFYVLLYSQASTSSSSLERVYYRYLTPFLSFLGQKLLQKKDKNYTWLPSITSWWFQPKKHESNWIIKWGFFENIWNHPLWPWISSHGSHGPRHFHEESCGPHLRPAMLVTGTTVFPFSH